MCRVARGQPEQIRTIIQGGLHLQWGNGGGKTPGGIGKGWWKKRRAKGWWGLIWAAVHEGPILNLFKFPARAETGLWF